MVKVIWFSLEIGRLLPNVIKIYLNRQRSIADSLEYVSPLLRLVISTLNSIWWSPFQKSVSKTCQLITSYLFVHLSVIYNWCYFYRRIAKYENCCGKYSNLIVQYFLIFQHLHNFMVYPIFFYRLFDWYLIHLMIWKRTKALTRSFLATTSRICIPPYLIVQNHWYIFFQKTTIRNVSICFAQQHAFHLRKWKMKEFIILIMDEHSICISTVLQCMHFVFTLAMCKCWSKIFWT